MTVYYDEIHIRSKHENDMIDITNDIKKIVEKSQIREGIVCVFVPGSTGSIISLEYEPGLKKDIPRALETIAPRDIHYNHHETWHDDNGRSHVKASILGPQMTVPLHEHQLIHGTWQQIVFLELDTQNRNRTIVVQIVGEP
jgi:secondary thiamine-phosphate synthase enzyme